MSDLPARQECIFAGVLCTSWPFNLFLRLYPQFLKLPVQGREIDAELVRGRFLVALVLGKALLNAAPILNQHEFACLPLLLLTNSSTGIGSA